MCIRPWPPSRLQLPDSTPQLVNTLCDKSCGVDRAWEQALFGSWQSVLQLYRMAIDPCLYKAWETI